MFYECSLSGSFKAKHSSSSTRDFCSRREFSALTFSNTVSKLLNVGLLSASYIQQCIKISLINGGKVSGISKVLMLKQTCLFISSKFIWSYGSSPETDVNIFCRYFVIKLCDCLDWQALLNILEREQIYFVTSILK